MKSFLLLCWSLLASGSAAALTGQEYLALCSLETLKSLQKPAQEARMAFCTGFVRGVIHGHYVTSKYYDKDPLFCIPSERTYMELTGEVVSRLGVEKTNLDKPVSGLAIVYFSRAFPCERRQQQ